MNRAGAAPCWMTLAAALVLVPACAGKKDGEQVYPVSGEVFFRGEPAELLHPLELPHHAHGWLSADREVEV